LAKPKLWEVVGSHIEVNPHEAQQKILESRARYLAMVCGTGAGKTSFGAIWLMTRIQEFPHGDHMAVAPNFRMLTRVVLPMLQSLFIDTLKCATHKKVDQLFELDWGGRILLGSADKPLSLEGAHVQSVWLDEAGQMDGLVWDVAQRRVGYTQGKILLTSTPYAWNWLKFEVQDRFKNGDPEFFVVNTASTINPAYTKEELERQKARLPEWKFRMMYMGEWARPEGLIYEIDEANVVDPFEIPAEWPVKVGLDWGINHPTAAVWIAESPEGIDYIFKSWKQPGLMPDQSAMIVAGQSQGMKVISWAGDGNGIAAPVWIEAFRQAGMPVRGSRASVMSGISDVDVKLRTHKLVCMRDVRDILDGFSTYSWKTRRVGGQDRQTIDEPMDTDDDLMDALRYAEYGAVYYGEPPKELRDMTATSRWGDASSNRWKGHAR
jgi:phage terminase large subunit